MNTGTSYGTSSWTCYGDPSPERAKNKQPAKKHLRKTFLNGRFDRDATQELRKTCKRLDTYIFFIKIYSELSTI